MTTARHSRQVNELLEVFRRASKPPTPLERIEAALAAALDVAKDESRPEADRVKELRTRIKLMEI